MIGDISWPEHALIFTIPIHVAIQNDINTIIWGENSQFEYEALKMNLKRRYLIVIATRFGGLNGLRVSDLEGQENII